MSKKKGSAYFSGSAISSEEFGRVSRARLDNSGYIDINKAVEEGIEREDGQDKKYVEELVAKFL